jgi:hypothetical protein
MTGWRRYDSSLFPVFHERFEERWGKGTAPFLDPTVLDQPIPRAQWVNVDTGAAVVVAPIWTDDEEQRSFGIFYLPPAGDIWVLRPGYTEYMEPADHNDVRASLRNDAFKKAVAHARDFIFGPELGDSKL